VGALTPFDLAKPGIAGQSRSPCILPNSIFWRRQINIIHSCQNASPQALDLCKAGRSQKNKQEKNPKPEVKTYRVKSRTCYDYFPHSAWLSPQKWLLIN
jgi:hypothetical protein